MTTRFFLRLAATIAGFIGVILLIGAVLPRGYTLETEIEIAATPSEIFPFLNNLNNWQQWSSYGSVVNPDINLKSGPKVEGLDASMSWSEKRGSGKLWITKSEENREVTYAVNCANFPRMDSQMLLEPVADNKTKVRWSSSGNLPRGPFYGWFGRYFAGALRADYQSSLVRLKKLVERSPTD